jgi:hypothetical protein
VRASGDRDFWGTGATSVRYLDQLCAWTMLLVSALFMLLMEILHPQGAWLESHLPLAPGCNGEFSKASK